MLYCFNCFISLRLVSCSLKLSGVLWSNKFGPLFFSIPSLSCLTDWFYCRWQNFAMWRRNKPMMCHFRLQPRSRWEPPLFWVVTQRTVVILITATRCVTTHKIWRFSISSSDSQVTGWELRNSDHPISSDGQRSSCGRSYVREGQGFALRWMKSFLLVVNCVCWLEHTAVWRLQYMRLVRMEHDSPLIWYDISLLHFGLHQVWQRLVKLYKNNKETAIYTKGEAMHETIQKTQTTQNRKQTEY